MVKIQGEISQVPRPLYKTLALFQGWCYIYMYIRTT